MQLFVNDLSIHGQFPDILTFKGAIRRVMKMRQIAQQFGHQLYCHRSLAYAQVTKELSMPQAIQYRSMSREMSLFYATFCLSLTSFFSGFPGLRYTV